jgi:salicylate hydroxylase
MTTHEGTSELRVAIIGAGIGGAAAAVALQRQGIHVDIYEQASALREVGAAVVMASPTMKLFQQWGIVDQVERLGVRTHWMETFTAKGDTLGRQAFPSQTADPGENWVCIIHRADVHNTLLGQIAPSSLHLGRKCEEMIDHVDHAEVRFVDGSSITADLVIAADGIHSLGRSLISTDTPTYSGYHACRALVTREDALGLVSEDTMPVWLNNDVVVMLLPVRSGTQICVDVIIPSSDSLGESWSATIEKAAILEKIQGFKPELLQVIRNIEEPIGDRALFDREPIEHWSLKHITLLGDAAHPMLPAQGQGANMAIQDAAVLADVLSEMAPSGIQEALQRYEAQRKPITAMYQKKSRLFATESPANYSPLKEN